MCVLCVRLLSDVCGHQVEKVLDSKVFKIEHEVYPDGVDPDAPAEKDEETEVDDADLVSDASTIRISS